MHRDNNRAERLLSTYKQDGYKLINYENTDKAKCKHF